MSKSVHNSFGHLAGGTEPTAVLLRSVNEEVSRPDLRTDSIESKLPPSIPRQIPSSNRGR
jgi:hypothetical protein